MVGKLSFSSDNLTNRNRFVQKLGTSFRTETLKHKDVEVPLELGGYAVTPVFDLDAQIMSLLLDDSLMHQDNIAEGYDIFTGKKKIVPIYIMERYILVTRGNLRGNISMETITPITCPLHWLYLKMNPISI